MSNVSIEKYKYCNWCKYFKTVNTIPFIAYNISGACVGELGSYLCAWVYGCSKFKYNIHGVFDFLSPTEIDEYIEAYHLRFFARSVEKGKCKHGQRYR